MRRLILVVSTGDYVWARIGMSWPQNIGNLYVQWEYWNR